MDRIIANLVTQWSAWGLDVDLLQIRQHGPDIPNLPDGVRRVDLGTAHVNTALPALIRYLRRERPAALLTDKDRVNRIAILARRLAGIQSDTRLLVRLGTTVSVNLASRSRLERALQGASIRYLYRLADGIIVPSAGVAADLSEHYGVDPARIHVCPSPVVSAELRTLAAAPAAHPWLRPGEPPVILGVGELSARKDFETLLQAFAQVRAHRRCRLIILGRGRRRERLLALAESLGVAQDTDLAGFKTNPYAFMSRAALFALSSRWEGLGIVIVEALACGTPVVSTDCPSGPREILDDGPHTRLVPVGDVTALARAMDQALAAPTDPATLRRRTKAFSIEASARAYLQALGIETSALGEPPG
ncbi:glycosyltransferase [Thiohalocapsa marina]|uniref:glycosyltransferase n=1 Tax=Thiohalocapsa marina TaxID=424902 RepID=UPI001FE49FD8|nr:glycosyltransferase [Thiohalocapsa marina]